MKYPIYILKLSKIYIIYPISLDQKGCIYIELQTWGVDSWVSSQLSIYSRKTESVKSQKYKVLRRAYFWCSNSKKKIRLHKTVLLRSKHDIINFSITLCVFRDRKALPRGFGTLYIYILFGSDATDAVGFFFISMKSITQIPNFNGD